MIDEEQVTEVKCPFESIAQALAFFNRCNPARQKSQNLLEPERGGSRNYYDDFDPRNPSLIWAMVCKAIYKVINEQRIRERRWAWIWRNLGDTTHQLAVEDIAKKLGLHKRTIYDWLKAMDEALDLELKQRGLIAWDEGIIER